MGIFVIRTKYNSNNETNHCYLTKYFFAAADISTNTGNSPDESYVLYDNIRENFIGAGAAEVEIRNDGEYRSASMLPIDANRK